MPTLQIRDLPQDIYDDLVLSPEENKRSITQQAIVLLESAFNQAHRKVDKQKALADLRMMSHHFKGINSDEIVA